MKTPVIPSTVGSQPGARPDLLPCFRTSGPIQEFRIGPRGRALYQISGSNVRIFTIKILTFEPSPRKREPCHGGASGDSRFRGNDLVLNIPRNAEISHPRSRPRTSGDPESPGSSPRTRRSCNPWVIPAHAEVLQSLGHPRASGGLAIPGSSPRKRGSYTAMTLPDPRGPRLRQPRCGFEDTGIGIAGALQDPGSPLCCVRDDNQPHFWQMPEVGLIVNSA